MLGVKRLRRGVVQWSIPSQQEGRVFESPGWVESEELGCSVKHLQLNLTPEVLQIH